MAESRFAQIWKTFTWAYGGKSAWGPTANHREMERKYPGSMKKQNWDAISPIFKFSTTVQQVIYTTNAIESLNATYYKLTRQRSVFPSDTALLKTFTYQLTRQPSSGRCLSVTVDRFTVNWASCTKTVYRDRRPNGFRRMNFSSFIDMQRLNWYA